MGYVCIKGESGSYTVGHGLTNLDGSWVSSLMGHGSECERSGVYPYQNS